MDWLVSLLTALLGNAPVPCNATIFGYQGDEQAGGEAVCLHRDLTPDDIGIAHRDLPCGTRVVVENPRTGRKVTARVVDHGPYGALFRGRWVLKRKPTDRGTWRGCVDLTERAARIIRHNGFEPVLLTVVQKNAPMVKWQHTTVTRWRQWFDSTWGYDEKVQGAKKLLVPTQGQAVREFPQISRND